MTDQPVKKRPGWLIWLRGGGIVVILGAVLALIAFVMQSGGMLDAALWVIAGGAVIAVGALIARIAIGRS